jgi:glycosyltransferase involved in cell wall biosynthesis
MSALFINARFLTQPLTGVQRYGREVLRQWDELGIPDREVVCALPPGAEELPVYGQLRLERCGRLRGNLWEQVDLPRFGRGRLLFAPANIGPFVYRPQVVTIHDLSVFDIPQAYTWSFRLKYQLTFMRLSHSALRVMTMAQFSKAKLVQRFGLAPEKIEVIPLGCEHILRCAPDEGVFARCQIPLDKPFVLAVGSNSPHKNIGALIEAVRPLGEKDFNLVIAGGTFGTVFKAQALELPKNVLRIGYVSDGELRALYQRAALFVFPSLYKGFGIPPLEAMICGCPVACAQAASMPEVCGPAAVYFDPRSAPDIAEKVSELLRSPARLDALRQLGLGRAAGFTWEATARKAWQVLRQQLDRV